MISNRAALKSLLTETERKIVKTVIDRFLNLEEPTPQATLEVQFKDPDAVARVARYGLIRIGTEQKYLPIALGIELCGDQVQVEQARKAFGFVLEVLSRLIEVHPERRDFTYSEIEMVARGMSDSIAEDTVRLGLYIATDFSVFDNYSGTHSRIERVGVSSRILKVKNFSREWDRHVRDQVQFLENARMPEKRDAFLANLERMVRGTSDGLTSSLVERVAATSGYQYDEIGLLLETSEADGLIVVDPRSDTVSLTEAGVARIRAVGHPSLEAPGRELVNPRAVFVVHGHREDLKQAVARFLERLELEAIILHERPNEGKTLIEKFEANSNVGFAVVLLTPDDRGSAASESDLRPRARQNVILELGYFIGKLGRHRVCPIVIEGVEQPSDVHGVVYVPYDPHGAWCLTLAREIKAAGIEIDLNLIT